MLKNKIVSILTIATFCLVLPQKSYAWGDFTTNGPSSTSRWFFGCQSVPWLGSPSPECSGRPPLPFGFAWRLIPMLEIGFDPPANNITSISFSFSFNPSRLIPIVSSAGFLCSLTSSGDCPVMSPGVGTQPLERVTDPFITGPANGTSSIVIDARSVSVDATFSPSIKLLSDELFFGMQFQPLFSITDNTRITYSKELLPDADYSVISYSCTTVDKLNNCGSQYYTRSFRIETVPEHFSPIGILIAGILITSLTKRSGSSLLSMVR